MFVSVFLLKSQLKETNFYHNNFSKCWNIFIQYYSFNFVKVQKQINKICIFVSKNIYKNSVFCLNPEQLQHCDYLILLLPSFCLRTKLFLTASPPTRGSQTAWPDSTGLKRTQASGCRTIISITVTSK